MQVHCKKKKIHIFIKKLFVALNLLVTFYWPFELQKFTSVAKIKIYSHFHWFWNVLNLIFESVQHFNWLQKKQNTARFKKQKQLFFSGKICWDKGLKNVGLTACSCKSLLLFLGGPQWSIDHDTVVDYIIAHTKPEESITAPTACGCVKHSGLKGGKMYCESTW